jgi:glycosyltransferase involved in cell wall biosynthesis
MNKKIKVAIFTNVIPSYREGFYDEILKNQNFHIDIYCHKSLKHLNLNTISNKYLDSIHPIKYVSLFRGKLLWQFFPLINIFKNKYDIIISDGNVRHISQVLLCLLLKLLKKKIVIWSTVHSHGNNQFFKSLRLLYWKSYSYFLLYVERDVTQLIALGFKEKNITSINNGLNQHAIQNAINNWDESKLQEWRIINNLLDKKLIILSSRVIKGKFDDLIEILPEVKKEVPNIQCCIIGDGPYLAILKEKVKELSIQDIVIFKGAIYEECELAPWFMSAEVLVHPFALGLTLMHSLGYGIPVITHSDWKTHGPEFSIFKENITGFTYQKNDLKDFRNLLINVLKNNVIDENMRRQCKKIVEGKYNTSQMAINFNNFCLKILN